jgi:PASTA domain
LELPGSQRGAIDPSEALTYTLGVNDRVRFFVVGLVAAVVLVISPTVSGAGDPTQVVGYDGSQFMTDTIDGTTASTLPFPTDLAPTPYFAPAADGSVVFTNSEDPGPIWVLHPDGQAVELDSSPNDIDPAISYDGSEVAFSRFNRATGSADIYTVNSDGSGLTLVAKGDGTNSLRFPEFSPDGGSLAYWCGPAPQATTVGVGCGPMMDGTYRASGVMLMNADGSQKRMILVGGNEPDGLSWSPDGRWLTMLGCIRTLLGNNQETCTEQVFAYHTDGSDLFNNSDPGGQVTHETIPGGPGYPQFCGNSTQIFFLKGVDDNGAQGEFTYLINRDGTNRHEIFLTPDRVSWLKCVPPATGEGPPPTVNATRVTVPSVHRLSYHAAKRRLQAAHLRVGRVHRRFSRLPRNHILSQSPHAGAHAHRSTKKGPPVNLVLSRGAHRG